MTQKRCDQCVHWSVDEGKSYTNCEYSEAEQTTKLRLGVCLRAIPFWDASEWIYDKEKEDRTGRALLPEFADRKFFAQDGSDYRAVVLTAPDFYCAEHSPTEDSAAPPQS